MASARRPAKRTPTYDDYVRLVEKHIEKGEQTSVAEDAGELGCGMLQVYAWSARYAKSVGEEPDYHQKPSRVKQRRKRSKR